jgi:hypothetical protein
MMVKRCESFLPTWPSSSSSRGKLLRTRLFFLFQCLFFLHASFSSAQKINSTPTNRKDVDAAVKKQNICVSTPKEFAEAFAAREPRCVEKHLIGRVFQGSDASNIYLQVNSKPATFYSGYDALERYLRTGYPETFGYSTPSRAATLSQPNFPGLENHSNGFGLLQTIGYSPEYIEIDKVYVLSVFDARDIDDLVKSQNASAYPFNANLGPIQPTWDAVKEYYEWVYDDLGLVIPEDVIAILKNVSFITLTGCPSQCAYVSLDFPTTNVTTPIFTKDREDYDTCPPARESSFQITPTPPDQSSEFCEGYHGRKWAPKVAAFDGIFGAEYCQPEESVKAANLLVDALGSTNDTIEKAQWFRAFLVQSCIGTFSNLFSGNGFTYTGDNGLLTPTATEYIASPFNVSALPPDSKADIYFCINGLNDGRPDANRRCAIPSVVFERPADVLGGNPVSNSSRRLYSLAGVCLLSIILHAFM